MEKITPEEVAELNAKRTQGGWQIDQRSGGLRVLDREGGCLLNMAVKPVRHYYEKVGNRNFIAATPSMAALIAEQDAEIKRLRDLLEEITDYYEREVPLCKNTREAIAEAKALTKEEV
jgi:hypothetical protein